MHQINTYAGVGTVLARPIPEVMQNVCALTQVAEKEYPSLCTAGLMKDSTQYGTLFNQ